MILKLLYTKFLDCKTFKQKIASLQGDTQSVRLLVVQELFCYANIHLTICSLWFLGYSDPTHAISALKSSRSFDDAATNGPGICGADPDHITTALSFLRKASECVDAWLRGKLDIIPLSIPLCSKYVTAQEYEDVNADFDADHSDATQDRETCHYDFSNSSASTSSLKSNFSHYKAFCDERIKEQAGKASRARNQEELQQLPWQHKLMTGLTKSWKENFQTQRLQSHPINPVSEMVMCLEKEDLANGSSLMGNGTSPQHPRKVVLTKDKQLRNANKSAPGEEKKCEQDVLASSEFVDVQDTPAEPPAPANKKRKTSRSAKGSQQRIQDIFTFFKHNFRFFIRWQSLKIVFYFD
eukprot:g66482.t1